MKKYFYKLCTFFTLLVSFGCGKEDIATYNEDYNAVRFPFIQTASYSEPIGYDATSKVFYASFSFVEYPQIKDTIYELPIMLIGKTAKYDRKISFTIDQDKSSAPIDSYSILNAIIPANEVKGFVQFKIFKLGDLDEQTYNVFLTLNDSEYLKEGPPNYLSGNFSWNNIIPAPLHNYHKMAYNMLIKSNLSWVSSSISCYSPQALRTIVAALGWDDWDSQEKHGINYNSPVYNSYKYLPRFTVISGGSYQSYALKLADYIKKYNQEHPDNILIHDAGDLKGQKIEARTY